MTDSEAKLKELVARHRVCWEVWPLYHYDLHGERKQVGFEVDLFGAHDHPVHAVAPGCDECVKVFESLRAIADWVRPTGERDTDYTIRCFDSSLRSSKKRRQREDVELQLSLEHKSGYDKEVDPCEVRCLAEIEAALGRLGAHKGSWPAVLGP